MSHFTVGVIVPAEGEVDEHIEKLLAPYDENTQVAGYEQEYDVLWLIRSKEIAEKHHLTEASTVEDCFKAMVAEWGNEEAVYLRDGKTYHISTYNPKSKWDWYQVGGRWSNKFGDGDIAPTDKALALDATFFALVTPEGEWIEKGKMGWLACVSDPKDEDAWKAETRTILEKFAGHRVVNVDAHI